MTKQDELQFQEDGPFDAPERDTIRAVHAAIRGAPGTESLAAGIRQNSNLLQQLGDVQTRYPSLFSRQALGRRQRDLSSLVDMLSRSNLSNFEMFLPTRALLGRTLIMAEMNFYRFLRFVCDEAPRETGAKKHLPEVDGHLCQSIYTRMAGELLSNIASDHATPRNERKKAVLALLHVWEHRSFRIREYLPVLQATWEARRRIAVTGGTLLGTTEMFQLLQFGCDKQFVELLVRPEHTADEAAAFREFLFGTTTEQLQKLEDDMAATNLPSVTIGRLNLLSGAAESQADPALAMFEFFLSRHLQAAARRQASLPGPKRTAEEYVMLHYLEAQELGPIVSPSPPRKSD